MAKNVQILTCCRLVPAIIVRSSPRAKLFPTLDKTSASARRKTKQMREAVQASKNKTNLKINQLL